MSTFLSLTLILRGDASENMENNEDLLLSSRLLVDRCIHNCLAQFSQCNTRIRSLSLSFSQKAL